MQYMDEVWVPTDWHARSFQRLAQRLAPQAHVAVVPEAVDATLFDPAKARHGGGAGGQRRWDAGVAGVQPGCVAGDAGSNGTNGSSNGSTNHTCAAPSGRRFVFYSSFKFEYRKGWDLLIDAYWDTFTASDAVVLQLQTYVPLFLRFDRSNAAEGDVREKLRLRAMQMRGKRLDELAAVEWVVAPVAMDADPARRAAVEADVIARGVPALSRADVRDRLAAADAFVLPTRGEGWGLPIAEAMAMALPTIVTNHSGPSAYATDASAYLVPVLDGVDEKGFARPDPAALRRQLRQVVADSVPGGAAAAKGQAARKAMEALSPLAVAELVAGRVRAQLERRGWTL